MAAMDDRRINRDGDEAAGGDAHGAQWETNEGDWNIVYMPPSGAPAPQVGDPVPSEAAYPVEASEGATGPDRQLATALPPSRIQSEVAEYLQRYVYALVDPRDGIPFYIGKGTSGRVLQHGLDAALWADSDDADDLATKKIARINEIQGLGLEIDVWILRRKMSVNEYGAVEATVIDLLRTFQIAPLNNAMARIPLHGGTPLTNKVRGAGAESGITRLSDIVRDKSAPPLETRTPLLLITLGPWQDGVEPLPGGGTRAGIGFKPEWTDRGQLDKEIDTLAESVCCWWKINPAVVETRGIQHIVALYHGVTRALFEIVPESARTIKAVTYKGKPAKRSGFVVKPVSEGPLWEEAVGSHGRRVAKKPGEQAQFRYWPYT